MDYQDIVDYATEHTGVSISYADALKYVKKRRNYIIDCIRDKVSERYFYSQYYTDTVDGQNQYTIPQSDENGGLISVNRVEVRLKATDMFRKLVDGNERERESDDYLQNNGQSYYELRGGSIYIYPTPIESVLSGLFIEGTTNLADITVASIEQDFFGGHTELRQYVQLIVDALIADLYSSNRQYDDKAMAEQDFQNNLNMMIRNIANRGNSIISSGEVDLSHLY